MTGSGSTHRGERARRMRAVGGMLLLAAIATVLLPESASAQIMAGGRERSNAAAITNGLPEWLGGLTFCRLQYGRWRELRSGLGWSTDYPAADHNFLTRFEELTAGTISMWESGEPGYAAVRATDPELFRCPFLFMTDPGSATFDEREVQRLREYLLKGGFLWADDLWDDSGAWSILRRNLERILPGHEVVEITADHPLLSAHYVIPRVPQIPSVQSWRRNGLTSEVPGRTDTPRLYGIFGEDGRLMVLVSYNTDIADGWEREGDEREFFYLFSPEAYALAINVMIWIMSR
ncbi:MAG TPA: DUF4159 domain-containing protein [Longimicrobiales bacterium]|nr:DUF4159 domain-containing protein [Longimicrobiales bacterium]